MRFSRSRFGIVLWCAIALIIVIVPLWRFRATQQMQSPVVIATTNMVYWWGLYADTREVNRFGLAPALERKASRQFSSDANAQLAPLKTDEILKQINEIQNPVMRDYRNSKDANKARARLQAAAPRVWKLSDDYFAQYDALERSFPDSELIISKHLRDITTGGLAIDEDFFSKPTSQQFRDDVLPMTLFPNWISPATAEKALASARKGARLQPDNAFFPWMEAVIQFSLRRPEPALRALEVTGRCTVYDDYGLENVAQRLALLRQLRVTGWEDDFTEWLAAPFPQYSRMRATARAVVGQIRLARKRGDKKAALRMATTAVRASFVVARSPKNSVIGTLVGQAMCSIVWRGAVEDEKDAPEYPIAVGVPQVAGTPEQRELDREKFERDNIALFARLVRENGEPQFAAQTLVYAGQFADYRQLTEQAMTAPNSILPRGKTLTRIYWLCAQLLRIGGVAAVMWPVSWLFTRRLNSDEIKRARAQMLLPAMFCAGATGAIVVGASFLTPDVSQLFDLLWEKPSDVQLPFALASLRDYWPLFTGLIWVTFVVGGAIWDSIRAQQIEPKSALPSRRVRLAFGAALGFIALVGFGSLLQTGTTDILGAIMLCVSMAISGIAAIVASVLIVRRTSGMRQIFACCFVGSFWLVAASALMASLNEGVGLLAEIASFGSLLFVVSGIVLLFLTDKFAGQLATRSRIASGALALLSALAYFGITLWSVPVEAKTRAMMQRQLQIGEVAWLREQMVAHE